MKSLNSASKKKIILSVGTLTVAASLAVVAFVTRSCGDDTQKNLEIQYNQSQVSISGGFKKIRKIEILWTGYASIEDIIKKVVDFSGSDSEHKDDGIEVILKDGSKEVTSGPVVFLWDPVQGGTIGAAAGSLNTSSNAHLTGIDKNVLEVLPEKDFWSKPIAGSFQANDPNKPKWINYRELVWKAAAINDAVLKARKSLNNSIDYDKNLIFSALNGKEVKDF